MKKYSVTVYLLLLISGFTDCSSYKGVPYLKGSDVLNTEAYKTARLYDARIMPKDLLTISVNCTDAETSRPFNLTVGSVQANSGSAITTQPSLLPYLVDNSGNIDFPMVGQLHVVGLTKEETEALIREELKVYITETPIVTVRMTNYKISVLGEVNRPNTFVVANEKVNVFEALAMAGDMTVYGLRHNVQLIRENSDGRQEIATLNLNEASLVTSPYYYLQQNDILYVTPNRTKARNADISTSTTLWFSAASILVSLAGLVVTVTR
jgi:polysaccharide export outer membrane protein